eukprot:g2230.t1
MYHDADTHIAKVEEAEEEAEFTMDDEVDTETKKMKKKKKKKRSKEEKKKRKMEKKLKKKRAREAAEERRENGNDEDDTEEPARKKSKGKGKGGKSISELSENNEAIGNSNATNENSVTATVSQEKQMLFQKLLSAMFKRLRCESLDVKKILEEISAEESGTYTKVQVYTCLKNLVDRGAIMLEDDCVFLI